MKNRTLILTILILLTGIELYACSCPKFKNLEIFQFSEFEQAECIFIGEVLEINPDKNTYRIKVLDSLKGTEDGII